MSESDQNLIAHVKQLENGEWTKPHLLIEHVKNSAAFAGRFAKAFKSEEWACALGILHDVGKSTIAWQEYMQHLFSTLRAKLLLLRGDS